MIVQRISRTWSVYTLTFLNILTSHLSQSSPISEPSNNTPNHSTPRVDIPPSFFYTNSEMIITCQPITEITSGRWPQRQTANIYPIWMTDWASLTPAELELQTGAIRRVQAKCKRGCRCSDEGEMEENPAVGTGKAPHLKPLCSEKVFFAEKCASLWGCICTATLDQPQPSITGASREDYQRALDRIPTTIQGFNMGYQWREAPDGGHMGFTPLDFGIDIAMENNDDNNNNNNNNNGNGNNDGGPPLFGPGKPGEGGEGGAGWDWDDVGELPPVENIFGAGGLDFMKDLWKFGGPGGGPGGFGSGGGVVKRGVSLPQGGGEDDGVMAHTNGVRRGDLLVK
ncbi:hypothetical protein AOL_s00075g162 [Orbilia oligospora ATCC 24927]|uniref:Uncharacterized protein n=2 Tax=Orbilia oligospora TaxID=2813651 RepID=G1X8G3_ARTOA|nr:hypothetical protein AOL_s00075g162 [Orbilia oligospora ATCC 24927]EGX50526.1 hypothetical protein AOL_s00075g162 [Orbilia oligospora ATCC 24927]KAF3281916.1 hypothetical protein TWF970_001868 [Orbilia oligospora]